jgi:hypothetical protein
MAEKRTCAPAVETLVSHAGTRCDGDEYGNTVARLVEHGF